MPWLSPFLYMEAKFGPSEKRIKMTDIGRDYIFRKNNLVQPFWQQKESEI
jgi:hypothetical protein